MLGMLPRLVPRTIPVSVTAGAQRRHTNLTAAQILRQRFAENIVLIDDVLDPSSVPRTEWTKQNYSSLHLSRSMSVRSLRTIPAELIVARYPIAREDSAG